MTKIAVPGRNAFEDTANPLSAECQEKSWMRVWCFGILRSSRYRNVGKVHALEQAQVTPLCEERPHLRTDPNYVSGRGMIASTRAPVPPALVA